MVYLGSDNTTVRSSVGLNEAGDFQRIYDEPGKPECDCSSGECREV